MPPVRNIVVDQPVSEEKFSRSKELRQEMTPSEKVLWNHLRSRRLQGFKFRRQQVVDGFLVDFYCHAAALVVEVDGPVHDQQKQEDANRDCILEKKGLLTVRFTNNDVDANLPATLETIGSLCHKRTAK